ncbi:peptidoglycan DD-metalloendopeptidase family protein [Vacuolonema iberomarrocanum]|uniref:peptidoglycan DD-metalloendopeptidase family protein n=1 Tax=Vacuolonema iberomarrocanum TaxID=3454632 RepID=UPI0019DA3B4C|nr:peptidoglycan DD-metalloendopeptidase family protein [filamentous cyanobacterium LEGE 07170]
MTAALSDDLRKIMSRIPKRFTIFVAWTGKTPFTLSIHPLILATILLSAVSFPVVSLARLFHDVNSENSELTQENTSLNRQAQEILEEVQALEEEIDALQRRAGMPDEDEADQPSRLQSFLPQGGAIARRDTEFFLNTAERQLPALLDSLKRQVEPALEETLERENARPRGLPVGLAARKTSEFGIRRSPFGGGREFHAGLDFAGPRGTPIYVTAPGRVIKAEMSRGYGYHVVVDHGYGYKTLYAHLSSMAVRPGDTINRRDLVGALGNTGRSTGPHLHYEVHYNDEPVNPEGFLE